MPYIRADGTVVSQAPEPPLYKKVLGAPLALFWGILAIFHHFFATLCNPKQSRDVSGGVIKKGPSGGGPGAPRPYPGSGGPKPGGGGGGGGGGGPNIRGVSNLRNAPGAMRGG